MASPEIRYPSIIPAIGIIKQEEVDEATVTSGDELAFVYGDVLTEVRDQQGGEELVECASLALSSWTLSSTSALFVAPRTPIFPGFSRMVARLFANPRGPVGFQELKNTSFFQAFL